MHEFIRKTITEKIAKPLDDFIDDSEAVIFVDSNDIDARDTIEIRAKPVLYNIDSQLRDQGINRHRKILTNYLEFNGGNSVSGFDVRDVQDRKVIFAESDVPGVSRRIKPLVRRLEEDISGGSPIRRIGEKNFRYLGGLKPPYDTIYIADYKRLREIYDAFEQSRL